MDPVVQPLLLVISVTTTFLISRRRFSGVAIALASQPLWIYTGYVHDQWGVVATALFNVVCMAKGIPSWRRRVECGEVPPPAEERE